MFTMQGLALLAFVSLAVCASATVEVQSWEGYHETVAIPLATKIKAAEEAMLAHQSPLARIVGGNVAKPNSHAYLGGLLISYVNSPSTGVCGSALVAPNRLVSAAHCWYDGRFQALRYVVVLGSDYLFSGGQRIATDKIALYPDWSPRTLQNNFAVIYLPQNAILSPSVQPIALPESQSETFAGYWGVATGYGVTDDNDSVVPVDTVVSEGKMQVLSNQQCQATFGAFVRPNHVCGDGSYGVGTCWGDGGGPYVVTKDDKLTLIGVAAFGARQGCGRGFPSGFSRVSAFLDFIKQHL